MSYKSLTRNETEERITIYVETLTGKTFKMKISPQDTVRAIKYKIQRVEGIPMSHQHLLYNSKELEDSSCVSDPSAALKDQSTIKLVLSMRGGPISLVPQVSPLNRALRSLARLNQDNSEELPPGSKMAVVVVRIGDELNLLHVIEDFDDTFENLADDKTHLSEFDSVLDGESSRTLEENSVMMGKVNDLKEKMEKLSLGRKSKKAKAAKGDKDKEHVPMKLPGPNPSSSSVKLPSIILPVAKKIMSSQRQFSQVPILPDIITQPITKVSRDSELLSLESEATSTKLCENMRPKTCPAFSSESQLCSVVTERSVSTYSEVRPQYRFCSRADLLVLHHELEKRMKRRRLQALKILPPITKLPERTQPDLQNGPSQSQSDSRPAVDKLNTHNKEFFRLSKYKPNGKKNKLTKRSESAYHFKAEHNPESAYRECWSGPVRNSGPIQFSKKYSLISPLGNVTDDNTSDSKYIGCLKDSSKCNEKVSELCVKKENVNKNNRLRCSECKKRLSLCSTFECRCGFSFCSYHRYSETHHCTYDFKKESQKVLPQSTQSVMAPKLPKI